MNKKFLVSIIVCIGLLSVGCSNPAMQEQGTSGENGSSGERSEETKFRIALGGESSQQISASMSGEAERSANSLSAAYEALVSLNNKTYPSESIYRKKFRLYNFSGDLISESITARGKEIEITEFFVLDREGTIIFACPKKGSTAAQYVDKTSSLPFKVSSSDAVPDGLIMRPGIVSTNFFTISDFGYKADTSPVLDLFQTKVKSDTGNLSSFTLTIVGGGKTVTTTIKRFETQTICLPEKGDSFAVLGTTKGNVKDFCAVYTKKEMKAFFENPLPIYMIHGNYPTAEFKDPRLEERIRYILDKPLGRIYIEDLATISTLQIHSLKDLDISGLEHCTSLTNLMLVLNGIKDITPLASLTNLEEIKLQANSISDITPLASLTNLKDLTISENSISDITPLTSLKNLEYLNLNDNSISDITPLASLTNLKNIKIIHNSISDITPLTSLKNLKYLYLSDNSISDIKPLVDNEDFGKGTGLIIHLYNNPLSITSKNYYIPALEARGIKVYYK